MLQAQLTFVFDDWSGCRGARDALFGRPTVAGAYAFLAWVMPGIWRANCPKLRSKLEPFLVICAKISSFVGCGAGAGADTGGATSRGCFFIPGCMESSSLTAELNLCICK